MTGQIDIPAEGITLEAGDSMNVGGATITCGENGPSCMVTEADDGTVTSVGGMATAKNSTTEELRLALERLAAAETAKEEAEAAKAVALMAQEVAEAATEAQMELLTMVNSVKFKIDLADGYQGVESDVHNILAGGEATNGDVTFTCPGPADGPRCVVVVVVTVDDAGGEPTVAYTSLGGVATGANSDSVNETRAAIALTTAENGLKSVTTRRTGNYCYCY